MPDIRAGGLADNGKTRHREKRVSGAAVSQLSFLKQAKFLNW